ncbi:MAG: DUF1700 domain-containing protein [Lachnospiraceae bacterium]|nr:DUF1700 domain-containing protein [Lachnospiraceae bacterium]
MNKKQFLKKLNRSLYQLQPSERKKYMEDYEEILSEMIENGGTEEEAVLKLGDVEQISLEILGNSKKRFGWVDWKGKGLLGVSFLLIFVLIWQSIFRVVVVQISGGSSSVFLAGKVSSSVGIYVLTGGVVAGTVGYLLWKRRRWLGE